MDREEVKRSLIARLKRSYSNITGKNIAESYGRIKIYLRAVLVLMFMVSSTGLFIYGHNDIKMQEQILQSQLNLKIANIKKANTFLQEHPQYEGYIRQLAIKNTALNKILPNSLGGDAGMLSEIQVMADAAGISVLGVVPGEAVASGEYGYIPITLDISCNYFTLMNFLERMEAVEEIKPGRLMSVKNSSLTCKNGRLSGKLTVQAYFQKNV